MYLLLVEECWMSILASTFTCRGTASRDLHLFPNKVLSRCYLFKLHYFFSTCSHFLIPTFSPYSLTVQVFYLHARLFPLLWTHFKSPGPSTNTFFLCNPPRPLLTLIPIPTFPGQTISACFLQAIFCLYSQALSLVPLTASHRSTFPDTTTLTKYIQNPFQREPVLPMQNKYGIHFKQLKALSLNMMNYHIPLLFCFSLYFLCKMKQRHSYGNGFITTNIKLNNWECLESKTI